MPTTFLQAKVGSGKTESALQYLAEVLHNPEKPFARVWVLLASKQQEFAFRERLVTRHNQHAVFFNAEFFYYYELNAHLLNLAGKPARLIREQVRSGILQGILAELHERGELAFFSSIVSTRGLHQMLADLIYEFKQNLIEPDDLAKAARTEKDREIARIYARYQQVLRDHDLVDREGEGWLALAALEADADLCAGTDLLLVDGYDQFTPLQALALARMSLQIPQVVVTLTQPDEADSTRAQVIGKRFQQALTRLISAHQQVGCPTRQVTLNEAYSDRAAGLVRLADGLFAHAEPVVPDGSVELLEAPDVREETAALLRQVKRLLLDGVPPDEILIAVRDWQRYHTHIARYVQLYDLPALVQYDEALEANPLIDTFMKLLHLCGDAEDATSSFRRRDVLDVLRSPYFRLPVFTPELVDLLDTISRHYLVIGGKKQWVEALNAAAGSTLDADDEEMTFGEPLITSQQSSDLETALYDFFAGVTLPVSATLRDYVSLIEALIGQETLHDPDDDPEPVDQLPYVLNVPACIDAAMTGKHGEALVARDRQALNQLRAALRAMVETEDFLHDVMRYEERQISRSRFLDELGAAVSASMNPNRNPSRAGRVLITSASAARGLPHQYVLIPGLSEGIFPADVKEDLIYLDSERVAFAAQGIALQTAGERADDNGLFYELINLPGVRLFLSRPYVRDGKQWVESHLWRMVRAVLPDIRVKHLMIGQAVEPQDVATVDEAISTVIDRMRQSDVANGGATERDLYGWLQQNDDTRSVLRQIKRGMLAESARISYEPHDRFSGQLEDQERIDQLRLQLFGEHTVWSATRLNDYEVCPFAFFAGHVLELDALKEPDLGMDQLQIGNINHAILEKTYRAIKQERLSISADNEAIALEILDEAARDVLRTAPEQFQFRKNALWEQEQQAIRQRLTDMVSKDFREPPELKISNGERRVFALERSFGMDQPAGIDVNGETIYVRGRIDRIDVTSDNKLIIFDYKSGSYNSKNDAARNLQMVMYLEALATLPESKHYDVTLGSYWYLRTNVIRNSISRDSAEYAGERDAVFQTVQQTISAIRQGDFAEQPAKIDEGKCSSYCQFYQMCRLQSTNQYKRR